MRAPAELRANASRRSPWAIGLSNDTVASIKVVMVA
jgi:hypothetical protein